MPRFTLKRREPLVKFVRRAALGHLKAADAALRAGADGGKRAPAEVARARRELLRLRALLRLIRGPLGSTAFGREHGAVQRLVRRVTPHAEGADPTGTQPNADVKGRSKLAARPALLRALADLAEIRVRAAHWHVPDAGFDALAPALRSAWRQSARAVTGARAVAPVALSEAALTLHDQLRCVERVWPEAIDAPRVLARRLASDAMQLAAIEALTARPATGGNADPASRKRMSDARAEVVDNVNTAAALLAAETPAAFTRRVAAYWDRWRDPKG